MKKLLLALLILIGASAAEAQYFVYYPPFLTLQGFATASAPAVSPSGKAYLYYNTTDGKLYVSMNGAAYTEITTGSGSTPGGSDTQIQYNDAGAFGGDARFTFTSGSATVQLGNATTTAGHLQIGDGSATLSKVILAGDGSGYVQTPILYSDNANPADAGFIRMGNGDCIESEASPAGTDMTLCSDSSERWASTVGTFMAPDGTSAAPAFAITSDGGDSGMYYTSGQLILSSNNLDAYLGIKSGSPQYVYTNVPFALGTSADLFLSRDAAANIQLGADVNGAAVNQTLSAHDGITGTDIGGASLDLESGVGTGAGAISSVTISTPTLGGTGTTPQTAAVRLTVNETAATFVPPVVPSVADSIDFGSASLGWDQAFFGADPADTASAINLSNADSVCWESSPASTDVCITVTSAETMQFSGTTHMFNAVVRPLGDGTIDLGANGADWKDLYLQSSIQASQSKTLTDNVNASFVSISCAAGDGVGGTVEYVVFAEDGTTDSQMEAGTLQYSCVNLTGTEVCATPTEQGTPSYVEATGGTADMTTTWACDTSGSNAILLQVQANTGIAAPTAMAITYRVNVNRGIATVTPQ